MTARWERTGFTFLPERAIWWEAEKTLIVADLHLGKAGHFRRNGIAVPNAVNTDTLNRLEHLIVQQKPARVLVLGDLFHSDENAEWQAFRTWVNRLHSAGAFAEFRLIEGNHDILPPSAYDNMPIERTSHWKCASFHFAHDPAAFASIPEHEIGVAGHLHPAVSMRGKARQSLKLPCWWFDASRRVLVVPTFGTFTGSVAIHPTEADACWVTTGEAVISVPVVH